MLYTARSRSCYRNVYVSRRDEYGNLIYVGKVKSGGVLRVLPGSRSADPRECARKVLEWYRDHFGANWRGALACRKVNPYSVRRSPRWGGYVASVWVLGRREEVVELARLPRDRWRPTARLAVFASAAEARAGLRRYLVRRYGLLAPFVLWRERAA